MNATRTKRTNATVPLIIFGGIAMLILVLFGAKKLPTFARSLGRSMGEFKRAKDEFEQELHRAQDELERPAIKPEAAPKTVSTVERERDHHDA